jgi:hypothetical protein
MIISVNSFEEAKSYPVLFNTSEIIMDNNRDVFYVKSVDGMGKYTISTYKFEQIENERPLSADNFVTKQQFDDLSSKLDQMMNYLIMGQPNANAQGGIDNGQQYFEQANQRTVKPKQRIQSSSDATI